VKNWTDIWARLEGTIKRSSPTKALPVAMIRFSPLAVRGMSELPVCLSKLLFVYRLLNTLLPFRDHSVSPWRMMKTLGVTPAIMRIGKSVALNK
jgi:hypothetical protein